MKEIFRRARGPFAILLVSLLAAACIEDSVSTSPADQPTFSTDDLDLGLCFVGQPTTTSSFKVYNRHDKVMSIGSISLRDNAGGVFRINVDGWAGSSFSNIEIRPNDSIFVMVEATVPIPADRTVSEVAASAAIDFVTNGVSRSVGLKATARNVNVMREHVLRADTTFRSEVPFQIFGALTVAEGVTLTVEEGVELLFHDGASLNVEGSLVTLGTAQAPVVMTGDRLNNVVGEIPFDLMAGQWEGVTFTKTSTANTLSHTVIKNTTGGVLADSCKMAADGRPALLLDNCRLRNSTSTSFLSWFADVEARGTEFSDAAVTPLLLCGGTFKATHLTVANYYLFAAIERPLLTLAHYDEASRQPDVAGEPPLQAEIANTVFYGLGSDINVPDLAGTEVYLRRCSWKSKGTDDEHFINSMWDTDPQFNTRREDYYFDYTLKEGSPLRGRADSSLKGAFDTDLNGNPYSTTIGAFQ